MTIAISRARRFWLAASATALLATAAAPSALLAQEKGTSPLRALLVKKRVALQSSSTAPQKLTARITAESRSGVRRLRIRDYQFLSDSGRDFGGYNLGAGSWDTEVGVLASAVADEFVNQAARRGIAIDSIDVLFTSKPDDATVEKARKVNYPRNLTYVAYIISPASDAQLDELRKAVDEGSAVLNLVKEEQPIKHGEVFLTASPASRDPNLPPGLRDFLVEKRQAILRKAEEAKAGKVNPPYSLFAHARVEPTTGIRATRTGEGNFLLIHDSAADQLGYGIAPTVQEHQIGVLGTCLTHIFEIQAATRQVVLDSLEVRTQGTLVPATATSPARLRDVSYTVHIESPATRPEIDGLREAVEATCPVYNLLKDSQTIKGSVQRGSYQAAARPTPAS